jgi:hypothetical protein
MSIVPILLWLSSVFLRYIKLTRKQDKLAPQLRLS